MIEPVKDLSVMVIADLQRAKELLQAQFARAEYRLVELEARAAELERRGKTLEQNLTDTTTRAERAERLFTAESASHGEVRQEASGLAQRLSQIENSSIWRASYPIRRFGARFPATARGLRVGAKLVWWTATLQLRRRYRMWRDYRALWCRPPGIGQWTTSAPPPVLAAALPPPRIRMPYSGRPAVSVIIPTYGQLEVTLACLKSIADHPPSTLIEVIVVDDAYPGSENMGMLGEIPGIVFIRNTVNFGFSQSCSHAARVAKGRYILMLHNDTEVRPGAIDVLTDLLDARPDIGMAGPKLIFPDERLQNAGGIVWTDASRWNYGCGESLDRPEFNYRREVDYCSAASIMVRQTLLEALGVFNDTFALTCYEDTDFAFRIRAQKYKVVYEPRSVIVHHELPHGAEFMSSVKAQAINRDLLLARWGETLSRENYENGQHVIRARDRAKTRKIILVIDHHALEPDRNAGSRSMMGIIDSLIDIGWIVKFWPLNRAYSSVYTIAMEARGIEVVDRRWPGDLGAWMRENGVDLDYILIARPDTVAETLPHVMNTDAVLGYYGVDLHFARLRRQALLDGNSDLMREAAAMERLERRVWRNFDVVIYPSEAEAAVVRDMEPNTLACGIIPFCFDAAPPRIAPSHGNSILFVAGFAHSPNVDAALFLITEIIPRLEAQVGPVKVTLAGASPTEQVRKLAGKDVRVTGYMTEEELALLYVSHRVSVAPLRFGAGVKGKVVESLSHGLPLVTTSTGTQGIDGLSEVALVYDDADGIAAGLALLLTDDATWIRQSHAQTAFAVSYFSRSAMQRSVLQALEAGKVVAEARAGPDVH